MPCPFSRIIVVGSPKDLNPGSLARIIVPGIGLIPEWVLN